MMRGQLRRRAVLVLVTAVLACGGGAAEAQEMIEVPTTAPPPPSPPDPCCAVAELKPPAPPATLLLDIDVGPTYRRAFSEDFAAALVDLEVGAQNRSFGMALRLSGAVGATRVGLPYQFLTFGPALHFRLSPRVRLVLAATFGALLYERVSAAARNDPTVRAISAGVNAGLTVDLVRTHHEGALFVLARLGYDFIDNTGPDTLDTGSSVALTLALGYRY